jgi:hypothetical protein
MNNNERIRNEIMDLRDMRIRLQRKVVELEDKEFWEPDTFSEYDRYWLLYYKADIVRIKAQEQALRNQMR